MAKFDLVFEGGGAKGMSFVGALQEFSKAGHTFGRVVGTSAGAITAMLAAAGYSAEQLLALCTESVPDTAPNGAPGAMMPVFAGFMDTPLRSSFTSEEIAGSETSLLMQAAHLPGFLARPLMNLLMRHPLYRELFGFNECGGFYAGDVALEWIRSTIVKRGMDAAVPWKEFHARTGVDLSVVTTNTSSAELTVLNHRTAPGCPVAESVRMSMSIPFVWREMKWKPEWGLYRGRDISGQFFVDGAVLSNFALGLFLNTWDPDVIEMMGSVPSGNQVLGLYLDGTTDVPGAATPQVLTRRPRLQAANRVTRLIDTLTDNRDLAVERENEKLICRIPVGGYGLTEFRMSAERQQLLIASGADAMRKYLGTPTSTVVTTPHLVTSSQGE
jgi:NTE family protein